MNIYKRIQSFLSTESGSKTNTKRLARKFNISYEEAAKYRAMIKRSNSSTPVTAPEIISKLPTSLKSIKSYSPYVGGDPNNVLVIPDTHSPFEHPEAIAFCRAMQEKYNCGTVIHIGDVVDNYAISRYDKDPSSMAISAEYEETLRKLKAWYKTFPTVKVCIGNHDARIFRKVALAGLPANWLKNLRDILEAPSTWEFEFTHEHNGVIYTHGTTTSGDMSALNMAKENRQSTVIGHLHTVAGVRYIASRKSTIFGMNVGCLVDDTAYAFAYGKETARKSILSCGIVLNGKTAIVECLH